MSKNLQTTTFNLKNLTKSKAIITYFYTPLNYLKLTFITQTHNQAIYKLTFNFYSLNILGY